GLDASAALIACARLRLPSAEFTVGELEELPHADASFGVVTGFNSFQYAADPMHAPREAARVAAGGRVLVAVWGREEDSEAAASVKALGAFLPPPPPSAPGPFALSADGALEQLAASAGLTVTERVEVATVWEYPDEKTLRRGLLAPGPPPCARSRRPAGRQGAGPSSTRTRRIARATAAIASRTRSSTSWRAGEARTARRTGRRRRA